MTRGIFQSRGTFTILNFSAENTNWQMTSLSFSRSVCQNLSTERTTRCSLSSGMRMRRSSTWERLLARTGLGGKIPIWISTCLVSKGAYTWQYLATERLNQFFFIFINLMLYIKHFIYIQNSRGPESIEVLFNYFWLQKSCNKPTTIGLQLWKA